MSLVIPWKLRAPMAGRRQADLASPPASFPRGTCISFTSLWRVNGEIELFISEDPGVARHLKATQEIPKGVGRERILSRGGEVLVWWLELRKYACPVANVLHKFSSLRTEG